MNANNELSSKIYRGVIYGRGNCRQSLQQVNSYHHLHRYQWCQQVFATRQLCSESWRGDDANSMGHYLLTWLVKVFEHSRRGQYAMQPMLTRHANHLSDQGLVIWRLIRNLRYGLRCSQSGGSLFTDCFDVPRCRLTINPSLSFHCTWQRRPIHLEALITSNSQYRLNMHW